jgi:hypothetical protein
MITYELLNSSHNDSRLRDDRRKQESKDMHRMPPTIEPLSQNALDETFV